MNHRLPRLLASVAAVLLLVAGCSSGASEDAEAGPAVSDLAPTYDARPHAESANMSHKAARHKTRTAKDRRHASEVVSTGAGGATQSTSGRQAGKGSSGADPTDGRTVAASAPVRVTDPSGDLSRSTEGSPASADIAAVELARRGDEVVVRTTFAGDVPSRQTGSKGMNVASFYDVDDNGIVDYEVWTSLADNGWGTGYLDRRKDKATFGPSTGIRVTVEGDTLVVRYPVSRIDGARVFRWSAASEWGSYASMSSSTSARDYAPDRGAVDYPG